MTTNVAVLVEGFAYLCFFDDGSWFQVSLVVAGVLILGQ